MNENERGMSMTVCYGGIGHSLLVAHNGSASTAEMPCYDTYGVLVSLSAFTHINFDIII